jgi:hypothetical protein
MNALLDISVTVRQIRNLLVKGGIVLIFVYAAVWLEKTWDKKYHSVGYRASPYYSTIPPECRRSAAFSGDKKTRFLQYKQMSDELIRDDIVDQILLRPSGYIYSLPESEKKIGYGMNGIPCMGYDFLVLLHGNEFKRTDKYVNAQGEIIATVTMDVRKPYREPLAADAIAKQVPWEEIVHPVANDASLSVVGQ